MWCFGYDMGHTSEELFFSWGEAKVNRERAKKTPSFYCYKHICLLVYLMYVSLSFIESINMHQFPNLESFLSLNLCKL